MSPVTRLAATPLFRFFVRGRFDESALMLRNATLAFPNDYMQAKAYLVKKKDSYCCCLNSCSVM